MMRKQFSTVFFILFACWLLLPGVALAAATLDEPPPTAVPAQTEGGTDADTPAEDEFNLPPEINSILASLGLYILTMFTLALGTEVAVDVVKQLFGLKSKPTAKDALKDFEALLPGSPDDFGISVEEQARLQRQIRDLQRVLAPVATAEAILTHLQAGDMKTAVEQLLQEAQVLAVDQTLDGVVQKHLHQATAVLAQKLALPAQLEQSVRFQIDQAIAQLDLSDVEQALRELVPRLQAELITTWIRAQLTELGAASQQTIQQQFHAVVLPQLANLGFRQEDETKLRRWLDEFLSDVENYAGHKVDIYLTSLNELLVGVERQRYLLQSPARRIWRRLCEIDNWFGAIFRRIEAFWNFMTGRTKETLADINNNQYVSNVYSLARVILELEQKHKDDGASRIYLIRTLSVIVGVALAYILQIDSAELLAGLLPASTTTFLETVLVVEDSRVLGLEFARNLTAGILLSGLAASAGSNFWHDRLSQLQAVRSTAEAAAGVLKTVSNKAEDASKK